MVEEVGKVKACKFPFKVGNLNGLSRLGGKKEENHSPSGEELRLLNSPLMHNTELKVVKIDGLAQSVYIYVGGGLPES